MKTVAKILIIALSAGLFFTSCKKDEGGFPKKEPKFSKLSPEEHKSNIESAGISFVQETQGLVDAQAVVAAENLGSLTSTSGLKAANKIGFVALLASLNDGGNGMQVKSFLKDSKGDIATAMDSIEGIYTWNASSQDFDYSAANNEVVIHFPYNSQSISNDCELSFSIVPITVSGAVTGQTEVPSSITCSLKVNTKEVASWSLTATYDTEGVPTKVQTTIKVDSYKWQYTVNKSNSSASMDFLYAHGSKTLVNYGAEIGGNLNIDDIQAFQEQVDADSLGMGQDGNITQAGTLLQNVKMYFQVMDIKIVETANTKDLAAAIEPIMKNYETEAITEDQKNEQLVSALNSKINIYVMYVEDFRKIADGKFVLATTTGYDYVYNPDLGYDEYVEVTKTEPSVNLVFSDDSEVAIQTYFETGFEDLQTEMTTMVTDFQNVADSFK